MIPGPGIIPADGWWFIARSADGGHLMLIHTYQIDQTITSNHMQYNAWGIRDIDGYGCFVFEKDPNSIGAKHIQLEAGLQPRQPLLVPRAQLSDHPTNHRSYHWR